MEIVPRHPHLRDVRLSSRAMVIHEFPFGKGASLEGSGARKAETIKDPEEGKGQEKEPDRESGVNGSRNGGGLVNGFR